MQYELMKHICGNDAVRGSFIKLADEIFSIPLASWYENGFWKEKYVPYVLSDGGKVVAAAAINLMDTCFKGQDRHFIQIGTVMTRPEYRNQGLSRRLLDEIIKDWKSNCDALYLYANDDALTFYPKFGFTKASEYEYSIAADGTGGQWQRLNMAESYARGLLKKYYDKSNPYSELPMKNNYELLMFHCTNFMKECVYYSWEYDLIVIAEQDGRTVHLYDIYGGLSCSQEELIKTLPFENYDRVIFGFAPKAVKGCACQEIKREHTTLFVLTEKENLFMEHQVRMPELSHA